MNNDATITKLLAVAWLWAIAAVPAHAGEPARPNIVFILADDMRWDAMSCAGNPLLRTPHLDRLAREGLRFDNAFVTTPICATSRASILTGQYARRHGVHDFRTPLADPAATYPLLLRQAGYFTGFIGKWGVHAEVKSEFVDWTGRFDFWAGDMNQTLYWHGRDCAWVVSDGTSDRATAFCTCGAEARHAEGVRGTGPHPALREPLHAETEIVPAQVRSFLDQRDPHKPFCLSVSLKAPHGPWSGYAPRFAGDFAGESVPRRPSVNEADALRQPAFLRQSLGSALGLSYAKDTTGGGPRDQALRQYYRLILGVDYCVGEVLSELEARGLSGNTVVVFSSDNGHFAGEHGFAGKWLLHEESIRVPLLVLDPRIPAARRGTVCDALVLNIDLCPTFLEWAHVAVPAGVQGKSLVPLLDDAGGGEAAAPFRDGFFLEHLYSHGKAAPSRIEPSEGYRTRDEKYIIYIEQQGPRREQLFALRDDPDELHDLAREPESQPRLERLRGRHQRSRKDLE
ncbi:MAG: sulfatase [Pirellulales bacterium]|jgi:arylsulfatase A-like enzyme